MAVAKVIELTAGSPTSFAEATKVAVEKAAESIHNIESAWISEQKAIVAGRQGGRVPRHRAHHVHRRLSGAGARGYDGAMAVSAEAKLDAHALREDFPIFRQEFHGKPLAYLDSAASSQKPRQMLEAMQHFYETSYANVHRGVYELAERATEGLETAREKIRAHLNAPAAREVIFVRNATEGINLVAYAWGLPTLGPGDLVLVTELEHHSNFVPWQYIAQRTGRRVPHDPAHGRRASSCSMGSTRSSATDTLKVVALNLVSNALGTVNAVERIAAWAHEQGAIVVCDAAQAAPHRAFDVQEIGCDFVAISGHKMCGPSGIGAVWGRAHLLERMEPFLVGGHMIRKVQADGTTWGELPHKFEAGTAPMAEAVGFGAAVDYLNEVGLDAIARHEHDLTEYALERLAARFPASASSGRRPSGERASSPSRSTTSTPTTWRRCSTGRASPSARGTTAASR